MARKHSASILADREKVFFTALYLKLGLKNVPNLLLYAGVYCYNA
jgi:hypothetical protein